MVMEESAPKEIAGSSGTAKQIGRWLLVLVGLALAARFIILGWPQIVESVSSLGATRNGYIALAVGIEAVWLWAQAKVYQSALREFGGQIDDRPILRISLAAFSLSRIVPGGGAVGSLYAAHQLIKAGNRPAPTIGSMMTSWWVSMTTLSALVLGGVIWGVVRDGVDTAYLIAPLAVVGAMAGLGLLAWAALSRDALRARIEPRVGRMLESRKYEVDPGVALDEISASLSPLALTRIAGWSSLTWICDITALWLCFAGLGYPVDIAPLAIGYGTANLIGALPELTPGWLGVMEVGMAGVFAAWSIPVSLSVVAVLAYRLVSYWLPVGVGLIPAIRLLRSGHVAQVQT